MTLEQNIKNRIKELLSLSDKMVENLKNSQAEISNLVSNIVKKDKKGEKCDDLINKQRTLIASSYLLDQDLSKSLVQLSSNYRLAKVSGVELDLDEETIKRLEYVLSNEVFHFVEHKGSIVPRDAELYEKIEARIKENANFTPERFLEELRKSPAYAKES